MTLRLEHANICVRDIDSLIRFLQTAFPEFRIRQDKTDPDGERWVHIGTNETYFALNGATTEPDKPWKPYEGMPGVNHLAFEVDDVDVISERLAAAGYENSSVRTVRESIFWIRRVTTGSLFNTCPMIPSSVTITTCRISRPDTASWQ